MDEEIKVTRPVVQILLLGMAETLDGIALDPEKAGRVFDEKGSLSKLVIALERLDRVANGEAQS